MRFRVRHPKTEALAAYGWSADRGFWVELLDGREVVTTYDVSSDDYDHHHPVRACLDLLVTWEFFTDGDIDTALRLMPEREPSQLRGGAGRAARVIANLRAASD